MCCAGMFPSDNPQPNHYVVLSEGAEPARVQEVLQGMYIIQDYKQGMDWMGAYQPLQCRSMMVID